jgi:hypothetical protein
MDVVDGSALAIYNSTIAFQEAPVITSIEVSRGWCAFRNLSSRS